MVVVLVIVFVDVVVVDNVVVMTGGCSWTQAST